MILKPPFLFERASNTDSQWLDKCFPLHSQGQGNYPVGEALRWHGGLHFQKAKTSVYAIAEGTVVYKREPSPKTSGSTMQDSPLNYHSSMGDQRWTDDGLLVIRHTLDIGNGPNASDIELYSIYLHLSKINPAIKQGSPTPKPDKDGKAQPLGETGREAGQNGIVHFEIVCDQANLKKLVGREQDLLPLDQDGRTDAVYGSLYFIVPANSKIFEDEPKPNQLNPVQGPDIRVTETFIVGLRFDQGHAYLQCRTLSGELMGEEKKVVNAEYDLYTKASKTSTSYIRDKGEAHIPKPSAVYELMRYGRIINTEHEQLPANYNVPNWWPIHYQGKTRWVDLNVPQVKRFSDADFPHWMGWRLTDDCQDQDDRCDSPFIKKLLDVDGKPGVTPAEAKEKLAKPEVKDQLKKLICKFPSEWVKGAFDKRYSWFKKPSVEYPFPLDEKGYAELKQFHEKLSFWEDMNQAIQAQGGKPLSDMVWHFHPQGLIEHLRQCPWLQKSEMKQLFPAIAEAHAQEVRTEFNRFCSKHFLNTALRQAHFFGQTRREAGEGLSVVEESLQYSPQGLMGTFRSYYGGRPTEAQADGYQKEGKVISKPANQESIANKVYGTKNGNRESGDGWRYRGRGMKQLTGREHYNKLTKTYSNYWFSGHENFEDHPELLKQMPYALRSAVWFWVSKECFKKADHGISDNDVDNVTHIVNSGELGKADKNGAYHLSEDSPADKRRQYVKTAYRILTEGRTKE